MRKASGRLRRRALLASAALSVSALMFWPSEGLATVEEQRARLPPPAECADLVEGIWRSHQFHPGQQIWYVFTLEIHRAEPGSPKLKGEILSYYWEGSVKEEQPPPCRPGHLQVKVNMPATGSVDEHGKIRFNGGPWKRAPGPCDATAPGFSYNPDSFEGVIDRDLQEFQTIQNDGQAFVNVTTVFRRIKCFDADKPPRIEVEPPPLMPPKRASSRGCSK